MLSDSPRAVAGAPERTCSYGGAFRMQRDLTYRIVKFWSSWDVWADLRETSGAGETAALLTRRHPERPGPLRETSCRILTAVVQTLPKGISSYHIRLC